MVEKCVMALGFFDGVHIGHGALLNKTVEIARDMGVSKQVLTFDVCPKSLANSKLITPLKLRCEMLMDLYGMDKVRVLKFDNDLMRMSYVDFVKEIIVEKFNACHVVCGYDFRFGYRGEGDSTKLIKECEKYNVGCTVVDKVTVDGERVSSTLIKQLVESGDIQKARKLMGHGYSVSGTVVYGKQVGRTIGIPTANLALETEQIYPPRGVYATRTTVMDKTYISMTNIGTRPTVSDKDTVNAETYIFDFNENIYGKEIKVEFFEKIRDEKKFKDIEELRQQLEKDKESTAKYFKSV